MKDLKDSSYVEGVGFKCSQCDKAYTEKRHLLAHVRVAHEGKRYDCDKCNAQFTHVSSLKDHVARVHEGVTFPCKDCGKVFKRDRELRNHVNQVHLGIKEGDVKSELTGLIEIKEALATKTYKCKICDGMEFEGLAQYNVHRVTVHKKSLNQFANQQFDPNVEFKIRCDLCSMGFNKLFNYKRHISRMHPEVDISEMQKISSSKAQQISPSKTHQTQPEDFNRRGDRKRDEIVTEDDELFEYLNPGMVISSTLL